LLAKHAKPFSLIDCISVSGDRMQRNSEPMRKPYTPDPRASPLLAQVLGRLLLAALAYISDIKGMARLPPLKTAFPEQGARWPVKWRSIFVAQLL
jgi:hypothetical protein